jgi:hypothetical protein
MRRIDSQDAQVLAASDGDPFEIGKDARCGTAFKTIAEALLLSDLHEVVSGIVRARQKGPNAAELPHGSVTDHAPIMASLSQRLSA